MSKRLIAVMLLTMLAGCGGGGGSPNAPNAPAPTPAPTPTPLPIWTLSGHGNQVFDVPTTVARVHIQGTWNRTSTSNFIVRIGGRLIINEILRDSITYDGISLTGGGGVGETVSSGQIDWVFTEVR